MPDLQPTPSDILSERLSDRALRRRAANARLSKVLGALHLALIAVREAAAAGNIRCQQAMREIDEAMR